MNKQKKKIKFPWIRILSLVLALMLLFTFLSSSLIEIKILKETNDAAERYLAENTEYVNQRAAERLWSQVQLIQRPSSLESYYRLASTKIAKAEYDEALTYIEKCLELCSEQDNQDFYLDLLTKEGCILALLNRNEEAVKTLNTVIDTNPAISDVYLILAQLYYEMEEIEKLKDAYISYLTYQPSDLEIQSVVAQISMAEGDYEDATSRYVDVVALAEEQGQIEIRDEARHGLSLAALQAGEYEIALSALNELDGLAETYPDVYCNQGLCYMKIGNYDKAIECYTKSIDSNYAVQYSYYTRGICEYSCDNVDVEAVNKDLTAAVNYSGEDRDEETAKLAQELIDVIFQ